MKKRGKENLGPWTDFERGMKSLRSLLGTSVPVTPITKRVALSAEVSVTNSFAERLSRHQVARLR
jgi:hypothetical protein